MTIFKLPRLPVNWNEQPQLFERYWDEVTRKIEDNFNSVLSVPGLTAAVTALQATTAATDERTAPSREFLDSAR